MRHPTLTGLLGFLCLLWTGAPVHATDCALITPAEKSRLIKLVTTDAAAKSAFKMLYAAANAALSHRPNPIRTILTEGKLAGADVKVTTTRALKDMDALYALGYVYALTGEPKYAAKVRDYVLAWAGTNIPTGDPIDETNLEPLIVAYDLTRSTFSDADRDAADAYLRKLIAAEWGADQRITNWQSHRVKITGLAAYVLNDEALIARSIDGFKRQIAVNLEPDGSSYDFHERDALHYHVYDLEPLLALAIAARKHGLELYDYTAENQASLHKSVDFLIPYCTGEKKHAEYVHTKIEFDRQRAANGQPEFRIGHLFEPSEGYLALCLAAHFDPSINRVLAQMDVNSDKIKTNWQLILKAASSGP
jgi:hypothetical protein